MHKVIFYPVKNGDTSQIVLKNKKRLLFDFRHLKSAENEADPAIDLKKQLKDELDEQNRDYFDVVAFTHGDKDHIENSTEFFELHHAKKYQGKDRIKIRELWVPAAMILETTTTNKQSSEFVVWRQEARYRFKQGEGIQVFSKPDKLKKWLSNQGLSVNDRKHLITDAGSLAKGFSLKQDQVEFFCHSPFIKHSDEGDDLRNDAALIFQVRFVIHKTQTNYLAVGDTKHEILSDIVTITEHHKNDDRLDWDLFNIPHHCSYLVLGSDKGKRKTIPTNEIERLLSHGQEEAYLVSSSKVISSNVDAYKQIQPPHVQAKNTYTEFLKKVKGRKLIVTMEYPNKQKPKPLIFEISENGCALSTNLFGSADIISSKTPRAG